MFDPNGNYIPEWVQMEDDQEQTPDLGPFAQALKARFASRKPAPSHEMPGHGMPTMAPHIETSFPTGHEAKGFGGGGMKSL